MLQTNWIWTADINQLGLRSRSSTETFQSCRTLLARVDCNHQKLNARGPRVSQLHSNKTTTLDKSLQLNESRPKQYYAFKPAKRWKPSWRRRRCSFDRFHGKRRLLSGHQAGMQATPPWKTLLALQGWFFKGPTEKVIRFTSTNIALVWQLNFLTNAPAFPSTFADCWRVPWVSPNGLRHYWYTARTENCDFNAEVD